MSQNILFVGSFTAEGKEFIKKYLNQDFTAYFAETVSATYRAVNDFRFKYCFVIGYYTENGKLKANPSSLITYMLSQGNEVRFLVPDGCDDLFNFYEVSQVEDQRMISDLGTLLSSFSKFGVLGIDKPGFAMLLQGYTDDDLVEVEIEVELEAEETPLLKQTIVEKLERKIPEGIFQKDGEHYTSCLN